MGKEWIGVDLDGTLAYHDFLVYDMSHIGKPVPEMMKKVRRWEMEGKDVRILTARACDLDAIPFIRAWLDEHGFGELPITNAKDNDMIQCWDDRTVSIVTNTGKTKEEL